METGGKDGRPFLTSWLVLGLQEQKKKKKDYFYYLTVKGITARAEFTSQSQGVRFRGSTKDIFAFPLTLPGINVSWVSLVGVVIPCISIRIVTAFKPGIDIIS